MLKIGAVVFVVGHGTAHDHVLIKFGVETPTTKVMFEVGISPDELVLRFTRGSRVVSVTLNIRAPVQQFFGVCLCFKRWQLI